MSSRPIQMALAVSAFALVPLALWAGPAGRNAAPNQGAALAPSNSALDVPIEDIAASFGGGAVLDRDFPGLRAHGMYRLFKTMSLNRIAAMSHGEITPAMLAQAQTDLSALPIKIVARSVHQTGIEDLDFASPDAPGSLSAAK